MAAAVRGTTTTPYVVVGRYIWSDGRVEIWPMSAHRMLHAALARVVGMRDAWDRLVQEWTHPITWYVLDIRDYAEIRPGIPTRGDETSGKDETGRPYARREAGAGVSGRAVRRVPRRGGRRYPAVGPGADC